MSVSTIPFIKIYEELFQARRSEKSKEKTKKRLKSNSKSQNEKKSIVNKSQNGDDYYFMWQMFNNNA